MKVIDLLNKIANGEKVPKKIKYNDALWEYNERDHDYRTHELGIYIECFFVEIFDNFNNIYELLNTEVEVIELELKEINKMKISDYKEILNRFQLDVIEHINKIIDIQNYLLEKGNE